jgi:hypothetical protein
MEMVDNKRDHTVRSHLVHSSFFLGQLQLRLTFDLLGVEEWQWVWVVLIDETLPLILHVLQQCSTIHQS